MPTDDLFGHLLWSASFSACLDMLIRAISRSGSPELPGLEVEIPGSGICTYYQARYQCACAYCLTSLFSLSLLEI